MEDNIDKIKFCSGESKINLNDKEANSIIFTFGSITPEKNFLIFTNGPSESRTIYLFIFENVYLISMVKSYILIKRNFK